MPSLSEGEDFFVHYIPELWKVELSVVGCYDRYRMDALGGVWVGQGSIRSGFKVAHISNLGWSFTHGKSRNVNVQFTNSFYYLCTTSRVP
jgi:hypothetical protein